MRKILGMGNALTDVLITINDDNILKQLNLPKGSMQLVDSSKSAEITNHLNNITPKMVTGGSASNTINGIAMLGGEAGFVGKIGCDMVGDFFTNDMKYNGVTPHLLHSGTPSGKCTVLISPNGERTMATFLGAACELAAAELHTEMFEGYDIFHIEGYLVQNHELIEKAVRLAKELGLRVSIDLASYNVVEENRDFLRRIAEQYVDIIFANEDEAQAFTDKEPYEALNDIAALCEIAIVKMGKGGSMIKNAGNIYRIAPRISNCLDTTGAGDLYAAGFLYGLANDYPLDFCGKIASLTAGCVVEVIGAKMPNETWEKIKSEIL